MERLPNRRAVERMREAYQRFYQAADSDEKKQSIQEAHDEQSGSDLRKGLDPATGTISDD